MTSNMSNSKSKYEWDTHLPRMISLYIIGMSIPEICKAIQDEATGFTPGLSMVYNKFRSEGYPTDKKERAEKTLELAGNSGYGGSDITSGARPIPPASFSDQAIEAYDSDSYPPTSCSITSVAEQTSMASGTINPRILECPPNPHVVYDIGHAETLTPQNTFGFGIDFSGLKSDASTSIYQPWTANLPVVQRQDSFGVDGSTFLGVSQSYQVAPNQTADSTLFNNQEWFNKSNPPGCQEQDQYTFSWQQDALADRRDCSSSTTNDAHNASQLPLLIETNDEMEEDSLGDMALAPQNSSTGIETQPRGGCANIAEDHDASIPVPSDGDVLMSGNSTGKKRCRTELPNGDPNICDSRKSPLSVTDHVVAKAKSGLRYMWNRSRDLEKRDSGYESGRNSPSALVVEKPHPSSLSEFKGLYRVACQRLHEPKPIVIHYAPDPKAMERFKETSTCFQCLYSSIHNLSWSAQYLALGVFKSELRLGERYQIAMLDRVGNSALHYAASGGAGFEHFAALINAGADPYQINTAGQLFLHCWRPHLREIGSEGFDDSLVAMFHAGLIDLLNTFQLKGAFRWRDNEGRTVLDALASNIKDPEIRTETFRSVQNAGYPLEISSQYPTRKSSLSQSSKPSHQEDDDFAVKQVRQDEAWNIFGRASMGEPSYVDPDTGDNVLHALARLKPGVPLISKIREFVSKDIDLNLHNRDRDSPLAAFITERPCLGKHNDETGATMSKYLDALLWKDARHTIPNRINVNMRNREGVTALYYAAILARPDSVRSLIDAGANVNARQDVDGQRISILHATMNAKTQAVLDNDDLKIKDFNNVISYLEHENAVTEPSLCEERAVCENSVGVMPHVTTMI